MSWSSAPTEMEGRAHFQFVGIGPALEAAAKAYYEYRALLDV